MAQNMPKVFN